VAKLFFDFSFEKSSFPGKKLDSRIWTGSLLSSPEIWSKSSLKMREIFIVLRLAIVLQITYIYIKGIDNGK